MKHPPCLSYFIKSSYVLDLSSVYLVSYNFPAILDLVDRVKPTLLPGLEVGKKCSRVTADEHIDDGVHDAMVPFMLFVQKINMTGGNF